MNLACQAKSVHDVHMPLGKRSHMVGARVSEEERDELTHLADVNWRTVSELVWFAISEYLERRRKGAPVTPQPAGAAPFGDDPELARAWESLDRERKDLLRQTILEAAQTRPPEDEEPAASAESGPATRKRRKTQGE